MGAPATRTGFVGLLTPGYRKIFTNTFAERPMEHSLWVNEPDMPYNPVTDRAMTGLGPMGSKPEGTQFSLDSPLMGNTKTYEAVPYGTGFEITREMWDDDLYGPLQDMPKEQKRSSRHRLEVDAFSILNNGFNSSFTGFDGKALFATDHPRIDGSGTQANRPSPDVGFSQTGLQAAQIGVEGMVNERGMPSLMAYSLYLISPQNKYIAREILGSERKAYTADNEINALQEDDMAYAVVHYLTSTTAWYALAPKGEHDLNFFVRTMPEFSSFEDEWTQNGIFVAYQRHIAGFGNWQGTYGSTG